MILSRQEAFASKQPVGRSVLDAVGTSVGFVIALVLMGGLRELLGSGTFLGMNVFGRSFEPWVIMALPPGGFFAIGFILLGLAWYNRRRMPGPREMTRRRAIIERKVA